MTIGELVGRGRTADVYAWGRHEVVKLFHVRHHAEEEARNIEAVMALGVRTPKMSRIIEHEDRAGIVMERVNGHTLLQQLMQASSAEEVLFCARIMAQVHAGLHQAETAHQPNLKQQLAGRIRYTPHLSEQQNQAVIDQLDTLEDARYLCHYDLHPDNILITTDGPVVIDWANALIGDRHADLARTSMLLTSHAEPPGVTESVNRQARLLFHQTYLDEYRKLCPIDEELLIGWRLPTLGARLVEVEGNELDEMLRLVSERLLKV
ncbi:aminoglycoside phosphotransferase (APT) family kinase protein [Paenibacillus phyllosphaerae]|uniref:Aminoglycoside phosphotransferase (APT) family kinase protein n=1 Tax=Paenibacillus phyllosphaerae TaxID=274593 RepID=A0A7W5FMR5_9BACL|nr:aminoglycoside phosphotransferase (APT) family kinase protein [Paenibacillus phyllosphaerae]